MGVRWWCNGVGCGVVAEIACHTCTGAIDPHPAVPREGSALLEELEQGRGGLLGVGLLLSGRQHLLERVELAGGLPELPRQLGPQQPVLVERLVQEIADLIFIGEG